MKILAISHCSFLLSKYTHSKVWPQILLNNDGTSQFPKHRSPVLFERPSDIPGIPGQADGTVGGSYTFWHGQTLSTSSRTVWLINQFTLTVSFQVGSAALPPKIAPLWLPQLCVSVSLSILEWKLQNDIRCKKW